LAATVQKLCGVGRFPWGLNLHDARVDSVDVKSRGMGLSGFLAAAISPESTTPSEVRSPSKRNQNMATISNSRISVPSHTLVNILGGESVLLSLKSQHYYGLDEVGTRMWNVVTSSPSVVAACETLLEEYEVEPETLRQDLYDLLGKLAEQGLVEVHNE
jgi:Coenzyme PQQ synthesis protein D (PqqD)